ncbi:hypothetical protein Isop_2157 [Isosphaera pallida ATCC 43644]|uniref:Uncharacterized protein n=1 Tax=Isosphaera pallida (strain ATCC 43644 / DSM 9630 / IS1B) TaxID=575540 RepID=E8R4D5_ISOPI|nr:hypothetical protein [Isosphaera pallida]ADV62736.1 hypothetical protein Isop_2157 [Isosphaera pallida ATCC 43644]
MVEEHVIRLRSAWEWVEALDETNSPRPAERFALPLRWTDLEPQKRVKPLRMRRRFGAPPHEPEHQRVIVRLESTPGLLEVRLNGRIVEPTTDSRDRPILEGPWRPRNVLELVTDPRQWPDPEAPWGGQITVVVQPLHAQTM